MLHWKEVIATARLAACKRERYFTVAIMAMIPHEAHGLGTIAVTKDWVMMVDPEIVPVWGIEKTTTVIRHEVRHLLRDHHGRGSCLGGDDEDTQMLKNIAADAEINDGKEFAGDPWPGDVVLPSNLPCGPMPDGLLFEEYFAALRKQQEQQQKKGSGGKQGKPQQGGKQQGSGGGQGQQQPQPGKGQPGSKPMAGSGWCGSCGGHAVPNEPQHHHGSKDSKAEGKGDQKGNGEVEVQGRSEVEQHRIRKQVAEVIQQESAKGRGTIPAGWVRWADAMIAPPKIPWQQKLAKTLRAFVAWKAGAVDRKYQFPSRRQAGVGYGPGKPLLAGLRAPVPNVAIFADTSGSMGQVEGEAVISESTGILKATGADVLFLAVDAAVHSLVKVRTPRDLIKNIKGGGGTDFRPAFDAVDKMKRDRPEIIIFITDGGGPAPAACPAGMRCIWVLVGAHKCHPSFPSGEWGEFIEVD